jgi:hypothetical protein
MFEQVQFDDALSKKAKEEGRFKSSDLKYYALTLAILGVGLVIFIKMSK